MVARNILLTGQGHVRFGQQATREEAKIFLALYVILLLALANPGTSGTVGKQKTVKVHGVWRGELYHPSNVLGDGLYHPLTPFDSGESKHTPTKHTNILKHTNIFRHLLR